MNNLFNWIKNNKFAFVLILALVLYIGIKQSPQTFVGFSKATPTNMMYDAALGTSPSSQGAGVAMDAFSINEGMMGKSRDYMPINPVNVAPTPNVADRKVITEASMSLQVESVAKTTEALKGKVTELKGYVVNVYLNRPEFGENATMSVRVPTESLDQFIQFARENAIKIVNENVSGSDITDQYVDTEARLTQLRQQKTQLETIMKSAVTVEDYMRVQPYLTNIQDQIDHLVGQNNYADQASKISLVTIYLSTDELSLPYTPDLSWRPQVVFKNASRSLLLTLQKAGSGLIWLGVYSVLIVPALTILTIIYLVVKKKQERN